MNSKNSNNQILINYALSLQKKTKTKISTQELADFISGHIDQSGRNKVLKALNYSPDLLQQWLDINHILGHLNNKQESHNFVSFLNKVQTFIKQPWLIPATAMAIGIMVFLPQWMQPSNQELIDGIYQQWQPTNTQYESLSKRAVDDFDISNQQELFNASQELGTTHWHQFSQVNKQIKLPDLCHLRQIKSCDTIQKMGIQLGKIQGIVAYNCHKNKDKLFWQSLQLIDKRIKTRLGKEFGDLLFSDIDFEFCQ